VARFAHLRVLTPKHGPVLGCHGYENGYSDRPWLGEAGRIGYLGCSSDQIRAVTQATPAPLPMPTSRTRTQQTSVHNSKIDSWLLTNGVKSFISHYRLDDCQSKTWAVLHSGPRIANPKPGLFCTPALGLQFLLIGCDCRSRASCTGRDANGCAEYQKGQSSRCDNQQFPKKPCQH
jgi:hypothetical protein